MFLYLHELVQGDADLGENKKRTPVPENSNVVIDIMIAAAIVIIILIWILMIFNWRKYLKYETLQDAEDPDHKSDIMKSFEVGSERLHLLTEQVQPHGQLDMDISTSR